MSDYEPVGVHKVTSLLPPRVMTALRAIFATAGSAFTKGEADARYESKGVAYSKSDADARFEGKGAGYSRAEVDSKVAAKLDAAVFNDQVDEFARTLKHAKILNIGDSFAEGYLSQRNYSQIIAQRTGAEVINRGVGGSGFAEPGPQNKKFQTQIEAAYNEGIRDVTHIIIFGGQNDRGRNDVAASTTAMINKANELYPDARKIVFPCPWNATRVPTNLRSVFNAFMSAAAGAYNWEIAASVWTWLFGMPSMFASDERHPNEAGHEQIAAYIIRFILNGEAGPLSEQGEFTMGSGMTNDGFTVSVRDGYAHVSGWVNKGTNVSYNDVVLTVSIPAGRPGGTKYLAAKTNGGNTDILLSLDPAGVMRVAAFPGGINSQQIIIPPQSFAVGS